MVESETNSDLMYRLLVGGVTDYAIYLLDADGVVQNWNAGAQRAKGYRADEIVGENYSRFYLPEDRARGVPARNLRMALAEGGVRMEGWRLRKDGSQFWAAVVIDPIYKDDGSFLGFAKITRDMTESREADRRILHMAHHDGLTGLRNRVAFAAALDDTLPQLRYGSHMAVLYIDLDRFKPVNDSMGHEAGDTVLRKVAERLTNLAGDGDVVARIGGDEFAILQISASGRDDTARLASRIVDAVRMPFEIDGAPVAIGASIGIACGLSDGSLSNELLRNADLALYAAKSGGRGRFCFYDESLSEKALSRRILELRLRHAVLAGEFSLHYQPVVHAASARTIGFEALIRWTDPAGKSIPPAEFIPQAEDLGLMPEIGIWVLREACREAASWQDGLTVSVNVSATQLRNETFVAAVRHTLDDSGLPAHRLELEITETAILNDVALASKILHQIREMGVMIALDDFGTGFSSLSLARSLPLTRIKIDRSFIQELDESPRSGAIIRSITSLCDSLGISATAEGIETDEQRKLVEHHGCHDLQGYLFGRPSPAGTWRHETSERASRFGSAAASG